MKTLRQLFRTLNPTLGENALWGRPLDLETPLASILADSRTIAPGGIFVAIKGGRYDGHDAIPDALARGAICVIGSLPQPELVQRLDGRHTRTVDAPAEATYLDFPYFLVEDTRAALAQGNAFLRDFPSRSMRVVGVTGTDGKTTTSSLIEAILVEATRSEEFPKGSVGVITTVGARILGEESATGLHVTTPDAPEVQEYLAQMRDAGCTYAVVESTSHGLDQHRVDAVEFDIGVVTNITHEHLDYHGTRDNYVAAKAKLFRMLYHTTPKIGVPHYAILNADDAGSFDALRLALWQEANHGGEVQAVQMRSYGVPLPDGDPDLYATEITYRPDSTRFRLHWWWGPAFDVETPLIGEFNLYNVMAAASATLALGIPPEIVAKGIAGFQGVLGRMERMDGGQDFLAIVDFAHSPASLERALKTLRPLVGEGTAEAPGRLIAVFGSAGLRDRAKRRWMGQVSGALADYTVITAEDPRTEDVNDICAEIELGVQEFVTSDRYHIVPDRTEAIQYAVDMARPGDIVAAFGKGHERSMCYGEIEYPWSDQDAMLGALERRLRKA